MNNSANNRAGFTIVETLIVLSIAGLILLLVFLALPSLQRNSRNSLRRQDAATVLKAVNQYELNNTGNFPQSCGNPLPGCDQSDSSSFPNDFFLKNLSSQLVFYSPSKVYLMCQAIISGLSCPVRNNITGITDHEILEIYNYEICDSNTPGSATDSGAGYNNVVALFAIETASGVSPQCQEIQ